MQSIYYIKTKNKLENKNKQINLELLN